jgi:catechol 2,3-dioxygenase-like lactoylglutathione lyase family enzyme
MYIKALDHISINVNDLSKSLVFYTEVLGFKQLNTVNMDCFSITYLKINDELKLELFYYNNPKEIREISDDEIGLKHFAFEVEDVLLHEKKLVEADAKIILPTTALPELGVRALLFTDPNGVIIEFCEKL